MNAENLFRELWRTTPALAEILPVTRISVGTAPDRILPFMVLLETQSEQKLPTNAGHLQAVRTLKITCHTATRQQLERLAAGMDAHLAGTLHAVHDVRFTLRQRTRELSCLHHDHWLLEADLELATNVQ